MPVVFTNPPLTLVEPAAVPELSVSRLASAAVPPTAFLNSVTPLSLIVSARADVLSESNVSEKVMPLPVRIVVAAPRVTGFL